jgi:hypothetical protein
MIVAPPGWIGEMRAEPADLGVRAQPQAIRIRL